MKKIFNEPAELVNDMLKGFELIYPGKVKVVPGTHIVLRAKPKEKGKVKFVIGNGAGHEPAIIGLVGEGLLDMDCVGEIFTAPAGAKYFEALQYIDDGSPILMAVQNHAGDVLNARVAEMKAQKAGMDVHSVLFYDDIASAPKGFEQDRRGLAGLVIYIKIVGALAESGASIEECVSMMEQCRDNTRTLGVAVTTCTHPLTGLQMFDLPEDEMELGSGAHGEGGAQRVKLCRSSELAELMGARLLEDKPYGPGDEVILCLNGSGGTTMAELYVFGGDLIHFLAERGIGIFDTVAGNFVTTQELGGFSVSICKVDSRMKELWNAYGNGPCLVHC